MDFDFNPRNMTMAALQSMAEESKTPIEYMEVIRKVINISSPIVSVHKAKFRLFLSDRKMLLHEFKEAFTQICMRYQSFILSKAN